MKKYFGLAAIIFSFGSFAAVEAQRAPPGAGDKSLEDRNVKGRSTELERISRDAKKAPKLSKENQELQFREVKEDFEQIQLSQTEIVSGYTKSKTIDYGKIADNADKMNTGGKRLMGNLFPVVEVKKGEKKEPKTAAPMPTEIKDLIVDLDNAIGAFTASPMFTNPQVVNTEENKKARAELEKIINLSAALKTESEKLKK